MSSRVSSSRWARATTSLWLAPSAGCWTGGTTTLRRTGRRPRRDHRRQIDVRIKPLLGDRPLRKLTAADLDRFYAHQRKKGGRDGKPLGAATVRRTHVVVHAAVAQAVRWRWLAVTPAATASPPRVVPHEIAPDPDAVMRLLKVLQHDDPALHAYESAWLPPRGLAAASWSACAGRMSTSTRARPSSPGPSCWSDGRGGPVDDEGEPDVPDLPGRRDPRRHCGGRSPDDQMIHAMRRAESV
jgi:hypothetical protein